MNLKKIYQKEMKKKTEQGRVGHVHRGFRKKMECSR